ncbi:methyltransferase domain-containing protein [Streptomyces sp. SID8379]|uniref:class I SAM-dependent methyltransferase n=1 Tax=unclassified Streptomyces TaxID=2593676 RepID=UPI00035DB2DB|nr:MULTISPECIES: class I SAM-dependent methyltransferase [unclassified Streptomyces]MYW66941.1 methyltransferase domain-containing protein [Streptomyces sp. SID8379]
MSSSSVRRFYDELTADYHRIFPDWDVSIARQATTFDTLLGAHLGPGPHRVLDCACGIGTQAIGLALRGHDVTGTDLSPRAVARAQTEAATRGARITAAVADMRRLPLRPGAFDAVLCADNALPHLLTGDDVAAALAAVHRVLCDDGLLVLTVRDYADIRRTRPTSTSPQLSTTADGGTTITFQLWRWHDDGERYDLRHFQLIPDGHDGRDGSDGTGWRVHERVTTCWALTTAQLTDFATAAGFTDVTWHTPQETGFYQPVLTARR